MEEWFDVVDERDHVIDRRLRSEVHRQKLLHRSVHILVFNSSGELLLQKRSLQKDDSPGLWDSSSAGHVAAGEDYQSAARRELAEELGLAAVPTLEAIFKVDACTESEYEFSWVYRCEAEGPFMLDSEEIDEVRWLSPEQVNAWLTGNPKQLTSTFRIIWSRMIEEDRE